MAQTTDLSPDEEKLFRAVPDDGSTISNIRVKKKVRWADDKYWAVRDSLVDKGLVVRGRGRGGTLRRTIEIPEVEQVAVRVDTPISEAHVFDSLRREEELYPGIAAVLRSDWAKDRRISPLAVDVVARQGRRDTGGIWSRPDLVTVEVKTFEYVPGKFLDLTTFEVKPADAIDVQAVYEALAHRRSATHSYVWLHVPSSHADSLEAAVQSVQQVARAHGIGVIIAASPSDYTTWEEREEAQRVVPDPERMNEFIKRQLPGSAQQLVAQRLR